ncbi:MAG: serine/threonine protein kinase [Myxococcales bacterium]|nr:serine/threonine protein kinase [Myxococcales bacterium]
MSGRSAPPADPFLGVTLNGRFRIDAKLGEGGFGAVYRGVQLASGRQVAIKVLQPGLSHDENLVARFEREGQVLCNLRDAHTITTYDFDRTSDGTMYIAMELLSGRNLQDVFEKDAPVPWRRMLTILRQICSSLSEAHALGVVHRDLKPENIQLEQRPGQPEFVKVLDFGIAKVLRGENNQIGSPQLTATGQTLGTLEYMSPEQLMGKQLDGRSDVYALGVVSFELMTGRLPFPNAKGPAQLITAQLKETPVAPSVANPSAGIPAAVDRLVLTMIAKDRDGRFADVDALAAAIDALLAQAHAPAPVAPPVAAAPTAAAFGSAPAPAPRAAAPNIAPRAYLPPTEAIVLAPKRSWGLAVFLLVLVSAAIAAAVLFK